MSSSNELYGVEARNVPASVRMRYYADQALPAADGYHADITETASDDIAPIYGPDLELDAEGNLVLYPDDFLRAYYGEQVNLYDVTDGKPEFDDNTVVTIAPIADIAKQS